MKLEKLERCLKPRTLVFGTAVIACLFVAACTTLPSKIPPVVAPPPALGQWRHLPDLARQFAVKPADWRATTAGVHLKTCRHSIRLYADSRRMEVDGTLVWLNAPLTAHPPRSTSFYLSAADARDLAALHQKPPTRLPKNSKRPFFTVMLDPGHGGDDSGATSAEKRCQEKELVLDLARRIKAAITCASVRVVLSRNDDFALPLDLRVVLAANSDVDCLVSIHANAAGNTMAEGVETYLVPAAGWPSTSGGSQAEMHPGNRFDGVNFTLAYALHSRLTQLSRPDRGIKRARYFVLRNAPCPAVLIEVGFLSNPTEAKLLVSNSHRQRLANAIAEGIRAYAE